MTKRSPLSLLMLPLLLGGVTLGCSEEPIKPEVMAPQAAASAGGVLRSSAEALRASSDAKQSGTRLGDGFSVVSRTLSPVPADPTASDAVPARAAAVSRTSGLMEMLGGLSGALKLDSMVASKGSSRRRAGIAALTATDDSDAAQLEDAAAKVEKAIRDRVLVASNLESQTDSEAIYLLRPDPTCRSLETDTLDSSCVSDLTKLEVRVRMTRSGGGGARLGVLIGADRIEPFSVVIEEGQLALEVYLAAIRPAAVAIETALHDGTSKDIPETMRGTLRFALAKDGSKAVAFSVGIVEMIEIKSNATSASDPFFFSSAAAPELLKLRFDGDHRTIEGSVGLGLTEIRGDWDPEGTRSPNTDLDIVLSGLTGKAVLSGDGIKLTGIGLGPDSTFAQVRDQRIVAIDLNKALGRRFDADVTFGVAGLPRVSLTPGFDLSLAWRLMAVASDFRTPPSYLLDEDYRIRFESAGGQAPSFEPLEATSMLSEDGLRVVTGTLTISSSKVATPVTVSAGQCLTTGTAGAGQHPVLGTFKVNPCP